MGQRYARATREASPLSGLGARGLAAKIKFEAVLAGFLSDLNGKYKLRVTELTLEPGGHVGEHNHVGPGIRQVTSGYMTYVLPDKTGGLRSRRVLLRIRRHQSYGFQQDRFADGPSAVRGLAGGPEGALAHPGPASLKKRTGN